MPNDKKVKFIRQYVIDNDCWQTPSRTLAKMILAANPKLFGEYNEQNIDKVRGYVRYMRGKHGERLSPPNVIFSERFAGFMEPDVNDYSPFTIPNTIERLGILNDVHFPFQDKNNLQAAINFLKTKEIDGLLLIGVS